MRSDLFIEKKMFLKMALKTAVLKILYYLQKKIYGVYY